MTEADWARFDKLTDRQIRAAVASDPDAAPILGEKFWKNARPVMPAAKRLTSIRLDPDLLDWFKKSGKGYQTRINAVLRSYMEAHARGGRREKR